MYTKEQILLLKRYPLLYACVLCCYVTTKITF